MAELADQRDQVTSLALEKVESGEDRRAAMLYGFAKGLSYAEHIAQPSENAAAAVEDDYTVDPAMRWSLRRAQP